MNSKETSIECSKEYFERQQKEKLNGFIPYMGGPIFCKTGDNLFNADGWYVGTPNHTVCIGPYNNLKSAMELLKNIVKGGRSITRSNHKRI
jgi:hypothetical protein